MCAYKKLSHIRKKWVKVSTLYLEMYDVFEKEVEKRRSQYFFTTAQHFGWEREKKMNVTLGHKNVSPYLSPATHPHQLFFLSKAFSYFFKKSLKKRKHENKKIHLFLLTFPSIFFFFSTKTNVYTPIILFFCRTTLSILFFLFCFFNRSKDRLCFFFFFCRSTFHSSIYIFFPLVFHLCSLLLFPFFLQEE